MNNWISMLPIILEEQPKKQKFFISRVTWEKTQSQRPASDKWTHLLNLWVILGQIKFQKQVLLLTKNKRPIISFSLYDHLHIPLEVGWAVKYEQTVHPFSQKFATIENSFADGLISSRRFLCLYFQTEQSSQDGVGVHPYMALVLSASTLLCSPTLLTAFNGPKVWHIRHNI